MKTVRAMIGLVAIASMVITSAWATPGGRTGGTGSVACNDGTVTYDPTTVWPPNHKMQTVTIRYTDNDNDGDHASIMVGAITDDQSASDGSDELNGSGQPTDQQGLDWAGTGNHASADDPGTATTTAQVRAERSGTSKAGRTYDIKVTCTDTGGNASADSGEQGSMMEMQTVDLFVHVPHDQRPTS